MRTSYARASLDHLDEVAGLEIVEGVFDHFCPEHLVGVLWPLVLVDDAVLQLEHVVDGVAGNLSEDGVLVLQLLRRPHREEELAPVVVLARVGHRHQAATHKPQPGVELCGIRKSNLP